jgi:transcriptional regulator with XRE-family HTH domain
MKQLVRLRRLRGFSQRALAEESGVSPATIYELENGRREPNPSTLRKLAGALGVEVADLLGEVLPKATAPPSQATLFNSEAEEERRQWQPEVEKFIADAGQALDSPDLTQDIAHWILNDATLLRLKMVEEYLSASPATGYTYNELIDLSNARKLIGGFSKHAAMVYRNKFGESAKLRELEELEEREKRKEEMRRLTHPRQGTA